MVMTYISERIQSTVGMGKGTWETRGNQAQIGKRLLPGHT